MCCLFSLLLSIVNNADQCTESPDNSDSDATEIDSTEVTVERPCHVSEYEPSGAKDEGSLLEDRESGDL